MRRSHHQGSDVSSDKPGGADRDAEISLGLLSSLLGYNLRRAQVAVFQNFTDMVGAAELTPGQFGVLVVIDANPGLSQTQLGNELQGASLAGQLPGLLTAPAQAQLAAANTAHGLSLQNLAQYQSLLTPLAQLGSQTLGMNEGTTTQSVPLSQQIAGGAIGGLGLLGALGGLPTGGFGTGGILGGLANLPSGDPPGLPGGGSGLPWTYTFQNGRWTPTV